MSVDVGKMCLNTAHLTMVDFHPAFIIIINLLMTALFGLALGIGHELSHAVVCKLLGGKVYQIFFGMGPPVFEFEFLNIIITIRGFPPIAGVIYAFPRKKLIVTRVFISILAGVLFYAIIAVVITPYLDYNRFLEAIAFKEALFTAAVIGLIVNFLPGFHGIPGAAPPSDGMILINILSNPDPRGFHANYYVQESYYQALRGNISAAEEVLKEGMNLYPQNPAIRYNYTSIQAAKGEREEIARIYNEMNQQMGPMIRSAMLKNLTRAGIFNQKEDEE